MSDELLLVRPSTPRTDSIARISLSDTAVRVYFPEKGAGFNELVRRWGYFWKAPYFSREVSQAEQHERAAELAYALLAAGYCVKGPVDVMSTAVAQTFTPEPVRIISRAKGGEYDGWFSIWWHKERGGLLKEIVKRLPGSRWQGGSVVVPPEQFEAVLDFAEMYACAVSPDAILLAQEARAERDAAVVVQLAPMAMPELPAGGNGRPQLLDVPESVEIDLDLMEDMEDEDVR
jgi:hypothetical protein